MMDPVPLDAELVERFKDKTMAIVGYETDQAMSFRNTHCSFQSPIIAYHPILSTGVQN